MAGETEGITEGFDFSHWVRTGRLIRVDARWGAREVKFNPNHDPKDGRFTSGDGGGSAGMSRRPSSHQATGSGTWGGGGFSGGGRGAGGGGGTTGYYMTYDERQAYQRQHPGRDPYLSQPGDTLESIAAEHGLSATEIRELNGIKSGPKIGPGQVLALPAGSLQRTEKNGYTFGTDAIDRTHEAKGDLYLADAPERSRANQKQAGVVDRRATDDGGHFIAARFGGPTDSFNHFAQDANVNRGEYRALEDSWAQNIRSGKHVHVDITAHYSGDSRWPDSLTVQSIVNGRSSTRILSNEPKGHARGR
ncbi:DNA/RNA non-specific endonuclease [uncultured Sphingomonas sp.]|uniref:DNA/RNA non-specific endonuclease n=1 Tax=uncultured Sphingomonas sp. TaxID=158754 RepID=UPI0035CBCD6B